MAGLGTLLVLLAPIVARDPVGLGDWGRIEDPVHRRIASLLCGDPVLSGAVTVVPLFARVPSEAADRDAPAWIRDVTGRILKVGNRSYLRLVNPTDKPVLVPAGTVFVQDKVEVYVARDAVVPPHFAALSPAVYNGQVAGHENEEFPADAVLPPLAAGALLHGGIDFHARVIPAWNRMGVRFYAAAVRRVEIERRWDRLRVSVRDIGDAMERTAVGAVFLIADQPVAAHVFASNKLFRAALPDLLRGIAVQERQTRMCAPNAFVGGQGNADAKGRALAFLRNSLAWKGEWAESYGEGFEVVMRNERDAVLGHAIVDHQRRVLHASYYALGGYWPSRPVSPNRPWSGPAPRPPDDGGNETPPGVVDRKARPSLAESRQRARRPGPSGRPGGGG